VSDAEAEARQLEFLQWLTTTLLDSLYPGERLMRSTTLCRGEG
jgi:hypothetical protein